MHTKDASTSPFAQFTFLVKYLFFLSKFTFSEMKPMKIICFKLTFCTYKLGICDLDLLLICSPSSTLNRPNGTKSPKLDLIFISKQLFTEITKVVPEDDLSCLIPEFWTV